MLNPGLKPTLENKGYVFKKSKEQFIKIENEIHFMIKFRWDGRGGASHLDEISVIIYSNSVAKAYSDITSLKTEGHNWHLFTSESSIYSVNTEPNKPPVKEGEIGDLSHIKMYYQIPPMLSPEAQQFFNDMNLRGMKTLTFEEKYPLEKIKNCVAKVENLLEKKLLNFIDENDSETKILNSLIEKFNQNIESNADYCCSLSVLIKLYSKKLNVKTNLKFPSDTDIISHYKNRFGYMEHVNFDSMFSKIDR